MAVAAVRNPKIPKKKQKKIYLKNCCQKKRKINRKHTEKGNQIYFNRLMNVQNIHTYTSIYTHTHNKIFCSFISRSFSLYIYSYFHAFNGLTILGIKNRHSSKAVSSLRWSIGLLNKRGTDRNITSHYRSRHRQDYKETLKSP